MGNIVFKPKECVQWSDHVFAPMDHDNIRCIKCGCRSKAIHLAPLTDPIALHTLDYKVINRGKCMLCGKELTEGLFFCKECEQKGNKNEC